MGVIIWGAVCRRRIESLSQFFSTVALWSLACCPGFVGFDFFTILLVSLRYPCGKGSPFHRSGSQLLLRGHGDGSEADQHQPPGPSTETETPGCASSLHLLSRMMYLEIGSCFGLHLKYTRDSKGIILASEEWPLIPTRAVKSAECFPETALHSQVLLPSHYRFVF